MCPFPGRAATARARGRAGFTAVAARGDLRGALEIYEACFWASEVGQPAPRSHEAPKPWSRSSRARRL